MAFMDGVFRRALRTIGASTDAGASTTDLRSTAVDNAKASAAVKKVKAGGSALYHWAFVIHKWTGLAAAAWLAVLGLTGFFLDHDGWRWQMQMKVPSWLTTEAVNKTAMRSLARYLQINPDYRQHQVAGGPRGLWVSKDGGESWTPTAFAQGDRPQTLAIEPDPAKGWGRLWFATDNGVYLSDDGGASAQAASLKGEYVTTLAAGATPNAMLAVVDRTRVYRFDTQAADKIERLDFAPLAQKSRPVSVPLNRFIHDLHFGKAVFGPMSSLLLNDLGGLGMFALCLTGLLYWALPKWWKAQAKKRAAARTSKTAKKATIVWLFRLHSATVGIAAAAMILYLSITGIFLGHGRELFNWMRSIQVPQAYLTPAFALSSWDGWIDAIVAYPGAPDSYTIGNRLGMFTSVDGGQSWAREDDSKGAPIRVAARLRRIGDTIYVANGMAGDSFIHDEKQPDRPVLPHLAHGGMGMSGSHRHARDAGAIPRVGAPMARRDEMAGMMNMENMFMPSDVTRFGDRLLWKSANRIFVTDGDGREIERLDIKQPTDPGTPWFTWFLRLHMGTLFWSEWKWINDVFAVLAVFLSVTGLIRWWRQKWV